MTTSTDPQTRDAITAMAAALVTATSDDETIAFSCDEADAIALGLWLLGQGEAAATFLVTHARDDDRDSLHGGLDEDGAVALLRKLTSPTTTTQERDTP